MDEKNPMTRLLSLDVFRGLTIAVMIIVNSPGNQQSYPWLQHAGWNGCTLADLVFPFFIVIVGMSSVLSLTQLKRRGISNRQILIKIIQRSIYLFIMGLILNILPNHFDFNHLRIMGVLQRIAICYFFSSLLFLTTTLSVQMILIVIILLGYWFLIIGVSGHVPLTMIHNPVGGLDQLIFSSSHMYTPLFDPEGVLSTLPAIGSVLLGNLMGYCLVSFRTKHEKFRMMVTWGLILMLLGWIWSYPFPLNKSIWTSSYVLWTGGLTYWVYAGCFMLIEMYQCCTWSKPFSLLGKNAMLVYFLHVLFLKIQAMILIHNTNGNVINLRHYITAILFGSLKPQNASLCYAISYLIFWIIVLKCWSKSRSLGLKIPMMPSKNL